MTVSSEVSKSGPFNGNGVTTAFNYEFKIEDKSQLNVVKTSVDGVETSLVVDVNYTVTNVGSEGGGQAILFIAPVTGETITNLRNVPFTQEMDLENQGAYFAETVEDAFDLAAMRDQQLKEELSRAVLVQLGQDPITIAPGLEDGDVPMFSGNQFVKGPTADQVKNAQGFAQDAEAWAGVSQAAVVKGNSYRRPIFEFPGGEAEKAKPTATADFQAVINYALATGELIDFPKWEYPIRSLVSADGGVVTSAVNIDVDCALGAKFIVGDAFFGALGNVFQFVGDAPTAVDSALMSRLRWRGGVISAQQLTADHGQGSGFSGGMMNVVGFFKPLVEQVFFDGGTTAPAFNIIGAGAMDTGLGWNQNIGGGAQYNGFRGFYDIASYINGFRVVSTLAHNPITTGSAGSPVVTVSAPAHGMRNGDRCFLQGVTTFDGVTLATSEYAVSGVTTNTFQVTATSGTATTGGIAGGGDAVIFTNSSSNKRLSSMSGESTIFFKNWVTRCTNSFAAKRNARNFVFDSNTFRDTANGIGTSGVGEYAGGYGKRLKIVNNDFYNIMNWPIRLQGGGPETIIEGNTIENFGRQYYDGGATAVNVSLGAPISGIQIDSMDAAVVKNNTIRMTDNHVGATWIAGEEPAAIRLGKNSEFISGCIDCEIDGNTIIDVPQPYNFAVGNLRTRRGNRNFVRGATKASVYGDTGMEISENKQLAATGMSLAASGVVSAAVPHGLDYTPAVGNCVASLGVTTTNSFALAWGPRVVSTDGTNVTVAYSVSTQGAGGSTAQVNIHIK
jgi:hypothetical protein